MLMTQCQEEDQPFEYMDLLGLSEDIYVRVPHLISAYLIDVYPVQE